MGKLIAYTEQERETVRSGFAAVKAVLTGSDNEQKRSLLLCLDWFMDPYYGHSREIAGWRSELKDLLQNMILCETDPDVIEDCLQLLSDYEWLPFAILQEHAGEVDPRFQTAVRCLLNPIEPAVFHQTDMLYQRMSESDLRGTVRYADHEILWQFSEDILIRIRKQNNHGFLISTWHHDRLIQKWTTVDEDLWTDVTEIQSGIIFFAFRQSLFHDSIPVQLDRREYEKMPAKEKEKYIIPQHESK